MTSTPTYQTDVEALQRQIAELQAKLATVQQATVSGSGASAQGNGEALGEGSAKVAGDNTGLINTGTTIATQGGAYIEGSVEVPNGHFIGRDFVQCITQIVQGGEDPEEAKSVIALYLHALSADLAGLKLGEIDPSIDQARREPLQLADIYVPLDTTHRIPQGQTLEEWLSQGPDRRTAKPFELEALRPVSAIEALAAHRELTLLGKPGSGKSTFGASVLFALTQAWQGQTAPLASLGKRWTQGPLLPIRVVLRRFAENLTTGNQPARAGDLWRFISQELDASGYGQSDKAADYVERIARTKGALILLDGLDECGDEVRRGRVLGAVKELMRSAGPQCRFLLTARPYAWPAGPDPERGVYALAELNVEQIEQFIRAWYAALVRRKWRQPGEIVSKIDDLLQARQRRDLLPLAKNPLLLTLMATLHTNRGRLPDDRVDLYNDSVDLLLVRWNQQVGADKALLDALNVPGLKLSSLREVLEGLAFKVHGENVGQEGTADIGEDLLVRAFRPLLNSRDKAALVVDYIDTRAGLLIGQGPKDGERQFTFPHRTFQEFLAACHLAGQVDLNARGVELARQHAGHWKEVLVLAARQAKSDRGAALADALIGGEPFDPARDTAAANTDLACAVVAAEQLIEIGVANLAGVHHRDAVRKRVASWLAGGLQAYDRAPRPRDRAYMGDLLSTLGDPRFDPRRFYLPADDLLGFAHIPADPQFRIGTHKADEGRVTEIIGSDVPDEERNNSRTPTHEFYIARYPVTVGQFRAFIAATGYQHGDDRALRDLDSRPVRYIDWYEGRAYTEWLNDVLASTSVLARCSAACLVREGLWKVALPSELEWEKAARGGFSGAVYCWGDAPDPDRANCSETSIRDTSPVGCFPSNAFGLYDMIGNVWEWTRSRYDSYPYRPNDGRENPEPGNNDWLVVRGGSWEDSLVYARCSSRPGLLPDGSRRHVGFRVVLRPPPVS